MRPGHVALALAVALALGCGKKEDGDREKVGRPPPVTATAGGEGVPGGGATVAGTCAKLDELAKSEGGDVLEKHQRTLGAHCARNLGEEKAKMGDEAWGKFSLCIASKTKLSDALSDCEP